MGSARERLGLVTKLVADTGDLESIRKLKPVDATTNPSLILAAVGDARFADLVDAAIKSAQGATPEDQVVDATDRLAVAFGTEITKLVPGYVSTEVDARLSFDTAGTIAKAHKIISLYEEKGISKDRILIKIAATWEGIKAAEVLEKQGIRCNITLLFNFFQAVAAAEAKVTLISPFVGRILDWYKAAEKRDFTPEEDPGVLSVRQIYNYYKRHGHETIVMGASFRSAGEVLALAGCDRLTISPQILEQLETMTEEPKYVKLMARFTGMPVVVVFSNPVEEYLLPPHAEGHLLVRGCPIGGGGRPVEQKVDEHGSTTASCSLPDAVIRKELPDYEALSVNGKSLPVPLKLDAEKAKNMDIPKVCVDERTFRWEMNQDAMATEKLAEGIRKFAADLVKLETIVKSRLG